MIDVAIRLVLAAVAGAVLRMMEVLGWMPAPLLWLGLAAAGAVMSWRLVASRLFVVLLITAGHFVTYLLTREAVAAGVVTENPDAFTLIWNGIQFFVPLALPALGSIVALRLEMRQSRQAEPEITVESLLNEEAPKLPPELSYDSTDFD